MYDNFKDHSDVEITSSDNEQRCNLNVRGNKISWQ